MDKDLSSSDIRTPQREAVLIGSMNLSVGMWVLISCQKHSPTSIHTDYIYHKNEKGKSSEKDLPLLKNDITTTKAASQN